MAGVVGRAFKISKNQTKGYGYAKPNRHGRRSLRKNPGVTTIAAINGRGSYARKHRLNKARKALSSAEKRAFAARMAKARHSRNIGRMGKRKKKLASNYGTTIGAKRGWVTRRARASAAKRTTPKRKRASAKKRVTRAATRRPTTMRRRKKSAAKAVTKRRRRKSSKRRAHAKAPTTRRRRKHRRNKAAAAPKRRRKRRKAAAKKTSAAPKRRRRRKTAKRRSAPKRRRGRRKAHASKRRTSRKKRRSLKSNRRRRSHRRNASMKTNRRRRSHRRNRKTSRRRRSHRRNASMSTNRKRRSHKRKHRSNRKRHRRNGMFRKNGVGGVLLMGGTILGGFLAHRLLSNLLNTQVIARLTPAAPPAVSGIMSDYGKPIAQLAAAVGGVLLVRAVVKDDKTKQLLIGGIVTSALQGVFMSVLTKFGPASAVDMLAGPNDGAAARLSAMYGMGAGESIMPHYAPIGEYFQNPMGEYFQNPMGEYIASTNGLGQYERANLMEAAAGYGNVAESQGNHIDPSSDLDRQLTIAEAAAGVGAVSPFEAAAGVMPFEASAGMGAIASLPSANTWIPGSTNPQLWAGVREVTQNQSEHELASAGVLQSGGSQGIFG